VINTLIGGSWNRDSLADWLNRNRAADAGELADLLIRDGWVWIDVPRPAMRYTVVESATGRVVGEFFDDYEAERELHSRNNGYGAGPYELRVEPQ